MHEDMMPSCILNRSKFNSLYSRHEASVITQSFWTAFGQYMALHKSSDGEKINWINYKTGIKHITFRLLAGNESAKIAIELTHPDPDMQRKQYEQFLHVKKLLRQFLNEDWDWQSHFHDGNGLLRSEIRKTLQPVSIYNKEDWPAIISFFKPRLIALDEFWNLSKYSFQSL